MCLYTDLPHLISHLREENKKANMRLAKRVQLKSILFFLLDVPYVHSLFAIRFKAWYNLKIKYLT